MQLLLLLQRGVRWLRGLGFRARVRAADVPVLVLEVVEEGRARRLSV